MFVPASPRFLLGLDDRAFVITWTGGDTAPHLRPRFQMFNADGMKAGEEVTPKRGLGPTITFADGPGVEPTQFISISQRLGGNPDEEDVLEARLISSDGSGLSSNITNLGDGTINSAAVVKPLPGGGAVVTWTQKKVPTTGIFGNNIMAVLLSVADDPSDPGNPAKNIVKVLDPVVHVNTAPRAGQDSPSVAPIDGGIAFAWVDAQVDGSKTAIKARVLSETLAPLDPSPVAPF